MRSVLGAIMETSNIPRQSSPVLKQLEELHQKYADLREGQPASYIPELAKANPDWFGICLVTAGGYVYEVGDSRQEFTIQSISKPFVYGMALEDHGRADVLKKVGVEPTGDAFNAISLDPLTGRPFNPMINAGAIATTGLIGGKSAKTRLERMLQVFSLYTGRNISIDMDVYASESATGHRNRAIGHMLRNFDILTEDPDPVVDLYFKQCSISVTCRDLAIMAATLANHGLNPVTGKQAIRGEYVESVLSVMASCGTYDFAGEWIYKVGMPAKSGVAGGIIAVLPGQLGIGVFSPLLDPRGNSVRGIRVCEELSRYFDLHLLNPPNVGDSAIWLRFTGAEINSSRQRSAAELQVLREHGSRIAAYSLKGKMVFATTEVVVRDVTEKMDGMDFLLLDFKRVLGLNESSCRLIFSLAQNLFDSRKTVLLTHIGNAPNFLRFIKAKLGETHTQVFKIFDDNDFALEWCENRIIESTLPGRSLNGSVPPSEYEILRGLETDELAVVTGLFERRSYRKGEVIVKSGDEAEEMFLLGKGSVSVCITLPSGRQRRLATLSPGMVFGEMAVIDGARRSAEVVADEDTECDLLTVDDFNKLVDSHPRIKITILRNLNLAFCRKLRKANRELGIFDN